MASPHSGRQRDLASDAEIGAPTSARPHRHAGRTDRAASRDGPKEKTPLLCKKKVSEVQDQPSLEQDGLPRIYRDKRHRVVTKNIDDLHRHGVAPGAVVGMRWGLQLQGPVLAGPEALPFVLEDIAAGPAFSVCLVPIAYRAKAESQGVVPLDILPRYWVPYLLRQAVVHNRSAPNRTLAKPRLWIAKRRELRFLIPSSSVASI